jgi:hypothetical protein
MPGNGRGVFVDDLPEEGFIDGTLVGKAIKVVSSSGQEGCNFDDYATNTWSGWYEATQLGHCIPR